MTRPRSSGSHGKRPTGRTETPPPESGEHRLAATVGAALAGGIAFAVLALLGLLLYQRLWANSTVALAVIAILFGAAGLYAGWIAALMVFSAIGGEERG
jgi:hypothetical protein